MENATKLASAPQHIKELTVGYDMSVDERNLLKNKLSGARDLNAKDPNLIHKMKGPPWNLQIVQFRKRKRTSAA